MSQMDVLEFLRDNKGKKFTSEEIANGLGINYGSVQGNCKKLRDYAAWYNLKSENKTMKTERGHKHVILYWIDEDDNDEAT